MGPQENYLIEKFLNAIEERLEVTNQLRIVEITFKIRRQFPRVATYRS